MGMPHTDPPATDMGLPDWARECLCRPSEALRRTVTSGTRIGSGLATAEPVAFYKGLWDHVVHSDITDLDIRQGLFMAPHRILVGDALEVPRPTLPGVLATAGSAIADARALWRLAIHVEELERRRIIFTSAFLGPVFNRMIPDTMVARRLAPRLAGRNRVTAGYVRYQPVHFPDAGHSLAFDDRGDLSIDLLVVPMSSPSPDGHLSFGMANGVAGDVLPGLLTSSHGNLLIYLNRHLPFTTGVAQTVALADLQPLAQQGRLTLVRDDSPIPGLPADSFADPDPVERAISHEVIESILDGDMHGRALQIGIGRISALVAQALGKSEWTGRGYTEMLDPFTYELLEDGTIEGTHVIEEDGSRTLHDGLACTFAMGQQDSDFAEKLRDDDRVIMMPASRLLTPAGFHHGLGINNILAIDFAGNVNATARDHHPYSAVGGLATIMRGLSRGGVAYLCMKSTHRGPDGQRRSSILPSLPAGTPVTLTAPDLLGTSAGGQIMLATEHGVIPLNGSPQDTLIRNLVSIAAPQHRESLSQDAWERYRIHV